MSSTKLHAIGRISPFLVPVMGLFLNAGPALSQGTIATIAGNGSPTFSGDGGPAATAGLNHPRGLAVDSSGNMYISDVDNLRIRRISPGGIISTVAGNGIAGYSGDGGLAVNASLSSLTGLALDFAGNLYIADAGNRRVRKVTPGGIISTVAGTGVQGFSGDGGPATNAQLNAPASVTFSGGNLYIADSSNQRIRKVSSDGTITTIAGNGSKGFSGDGGPGASASLASPLGMAMDGLGNLYVADGDNNRIRRISPGGVITTVAGDGTGRFAGDQGPAASASLNIPEDVAIDLAGNLLIADAGNNRVRKVDSSGLISTVAGTGVDGFSGDGGPATQAALSFPWGLTTDATTGSVYIADRVNNRVRMVSESLTGLPSLANNSTVNAASLAQTGIAPGTIVSISGANFAGSNLNASSMPLPTVLGDTSVTFNGVAAPLFFVSTGQIYAQAPFDLPAGSGASIQVRRGSALSTVRTANVAAVSPGIFIVDQASNAGAILHADYSLVGSSSPARPGEYLLIYCTGLGAVGIPVKSGDSAPSVPPLAQTINLPAVSIAGLPATNVTSWLAPGFVGLYQINAQAPAGLPTGNQPVQITILGVTSNIATIAALH
jgi:uncharacterized protein (TIGR03437 family)